jgi:hypothetical protein
MLHIKSIFLGILAALFALVASQGASILIGNGGQAALFLGISWMLIAGTFIEEILKYAVIYKNAEEFKSKRQILAGSFFIGVGFSATEIYLNLTNENITLANSLFPLLGIAMVHLLTSVFAGNAVAKKQNLYATTARVLIFNITLHLLYNLAVLNIF